MRAWFTDGRGDLWSDTAPMPRPGSGELLLRVLASAVCRTDLHIRDGELPPRKHPVIPGHEVIGEVVEGTGYPYGTRVGVPWLRYTCAVCGYCRGGKENLCPNARFTGWDADGGHAEYLTAPADYVYRLPRGYSVEETAPMLCAGIIGFRAWRRVELHPGGRLGIYGFGGSAHLALQVAHTAGARVHVFTRSTRAQELARELGASSAQGSFDLAPEPLDGAIVFAPAGELVPVALRSLDRGGTAVIAGVHLSPIPSLDYERDLFLERQIRSVTANTRDDGRAFLAFAEQHRLRVRTTSYPMDHAAQALDDLKADRVDGAAVLRS